MADLLADMKAACTHAHKGMQATPEAITPEGLDSVVQAGVSPIQILTLLFQYGPQVVSLIIQVISDLKAGSFSWATWQAEFNKYGADVMALVQKIIAALGINVPPPVVVP